MKNLLFFSYLTGLIEGDGTIYVPKTKRNVKGKLRESITDWILCNKNLECELNYNYHENISDHYLIKCKLKVPNN